MLDFDTIPSDGFDLEYIYVQWVREKERDNVSTTKKETTRRTNIQESKNTSTLQCPH